MESSLSQLQLMKALVVITCLISLCTLAVVTQICLIFKRVGRRTDGQNGLLLVCASSRLWQVH